MTELERKIKAKIPGPDTGIEVRHTLCDICSPGMHCGINAYVKDGKVIKIEGIDGHPSNDGRLCTKGLSNRQYLYREDRILTPLKRVGKRGEGKFEPITWDEAYAEIANGLNAAKEKYGAESVAFYSGYSKWYRQMLRRLAYAFGSPNYGCESSACYTAAFMAWKVAAGEQGGPDMANSDLFLGWAFNPFYSSYMGARRAMELKEKGLKFLIVDTRRTPTSEKLADLFLQPRTGTDGALAHAIANVLIQNGWIDKPYIDKYVYGFDDYAKYVSQFNESNIEQLTDVPYSKVVEAAKLIHENKRISCNESSAPLCHHRNGLQNYRAMMALLVITGNVDRTGGQLPGPHTYMERYCGFETREEHFMEERYPHDAPKAVGAERFPLWYDLRHDMQANDLTDNILRQDENSVKVLFALGMNYRMFPQDGRLAEAFGKLDFFVDVDLFLTDTAKYADIVLPACTSMERGEFKCYPGGYAWYTNPVVEPLGESKSDCEILTLLARRMKMDDELLCAGYEACIKYIIQDLPITVEELRAAEGPIKVPGVTPYEVGSILERGVNTPTGKLELYSERIAAHPEWGLDALPTYRPPYNPDPEQYPFLLCAGTRIPNALHSRLHDVPWESSLLPDPVVEMSMEDAERLGIELGDPVEITTSVGSLTFQALPTATVQPGEVYIYHGYRELDINSILDGAALDPYSGFPAYRSACCNVRRK